MQGQLLCRLSVTVLSRRRTAAPQAGYLKRALRGQPNNGSRRRNNPTPNAANGPNGRDSARKETKPQARRKFMKEPYGKWGAKSPVIRSSSGGKTFWLKGLDGGDLSGELRAQSAGT